MDLRSTQLKDTYGNLLTIGTSAGSPTTGTIENGDGQDITALDVNGSITTNGLTIDQTSNVVLDLNTTNSNGDITLNNVSYGVRLRTNNAGGFSIMPSDTTFLNVALNGDVNFYDSTGTNPDFYWDASEARLGLGTNSPSTKLHLGGTAPLDSIIRQDSTVSGTNWEIGEREAGKWQIFEDDGDSIVATFASSGRLGLGTTSPQNLLHINKSDSLASAMQFTNSTTGATSSDGVFIGLGSGEQGYFWNYEANDLILGTSNAERMRIDSIGNVGIGTNPNAFSNQTSLTVRGTSVSRIDLQGAGGSGGGVFLATATETQLGGNFNIPLKLFTSSTAGITFETNSNPRMTIDSSGNVGIGTTSTTGTLLNILNTSTKNEILFRGTDYTNIFSETTNGIQLGITSTGNTAGIEFLTNAQERMRILPTGGITFNGDTATANALDDYEEGTFDLTLNGSTSDPTTAVTTTANYTKIGNVVHYNFRFDNVNTTGASGNISFSPFPFTTTSTNNAVGSVSVFNMADFNGTEYLNLFTGETSTQAEVLGSRTNNSWLNAQHNAGTGRYFIASITVHVV